MIRRIQIWLLVSLVCFMSQACSAVLPDDITDHEINNQDDYRSALGSSTDGVVGRAESDDDDDDVLDFDREDDKRSSIGSTNNANVVASEGTADAPPTQNNTESNHNNMASVDDETDVLEINDSTVLHAATIDEDEALLTADNKKNSSTLSATKEDGTIPAKSVDSSSDIPSSDKGPIIASVDTEKEPDSTSSPDGVDESESAESKVAPSDAELDVESEVVEPDVDLDVESEAVEPDMGTEVVEPDVKPDVESAVLPDLELDVDSADADAEPEPDGESDDKPKVSTVAEPKVDVVVEPDTDSEAEAAADSKVVAAVEPASEPKVDTVADPKAEAVVEPDTKPKVDAAVEPKSETVVDPDTDSKAETVVEAEVDADPKVDAVVDPGTEPKVDPVVEPKADAVVEPCTEPKVEIVVEPEAEADVAPKVDPESEPEVEPDVNVTAPDNIIDTAAESLNNESIESANDKKTEPTEPPTPKPGSLASFFKQVSEKEKERNGDSSVSGGSIAKEQASSLSGKSADSIQPAKVSMTPDRGGESLQGKTSAVLGSESKADESTTEDSDEGSITNKDQDETIPSGREPADEVTNKLSEAEETEEEERPYGYTAVWGRQAQHNVNKHLLHEVVQRNAATRSSNNVDENDDVEDITDPIVSGADSSGTNTPDVIEKESIKAPLPKSVNTQFVEGLDDIDKFLEEVEPPDELDVGAAGSSMQEVLIGQGAQILLKRVSIILSRVKQSFGATRIKAFFASRRTADGEFALFTREELERAVQRFWNGCKGAAGKVNEMWENLFDDESDSLQFEVEASKLDAILNKNRLSPDDRRQGERQYATASGTGRGLA